MNFIQLGVKNPAKICGALNIQEYIISNSAVFIQGLESVTTITALFLENLWFQQTVFIGIFPNMVTENQIRINE